MTMTMSTTSSNEKAKAGLELRRVIETLTREKGIPEDVSYNAIERAVRLAIGKHFGDDDNILVSIDGSAHAENWDIRMDLKGRRRCAERRGDPSIKTC